ncbi:T9SS type A sorting domain-containing protein [uncultured Winogradskyella sp.]|uniref:T9SS type A sorting domain-containing protein n=1 Tax=uncultured Winogradskyella sp. TaxID=395353 RepID=UPI002625937F|nr:T9SS type A sorting domain-containing protein [uncultured Winogradskyella sp.]
MKTVYFLAFSILAYSYSTFGQTQIGQTLSEFATGDTFGASVAISDSGNRILTSAPRFNTNGEDLAGRADAYHFDGTAWVQLGSTLEGISTSLGLFGQGLDMSGSGNRIAIGNNNAQPLVYEWNEILGDWEQMGDDLEFPGQPNADFKTFRFTQDENILVIGATGAGSDSVYQFQWDGTNWNAVGNPLEIPVRNELAISDNAQTVAVLFRESGVDNGIKIYTFDGTDWSLQFTRSFPTNILISDGFDLSADGTRLILSYGEDAIGVDDVTFETYDLINGNWVKQMTDLNVDPLRKRNNALRVSADGTIFIIGSGLEGSLSEGSGTRVYQQVDNSWELVHFFNYNNYDESILGNVDITPDGSKVIFGRSLINTIGFVEVYDISELLGIDKHRLTDAKIHPNPTSGYFTIKLPSNQNFSEIIISDVFGKVVQRVKMNAGDTIGDLNLNVHGNSGLYFVSIISSDGKTSFKLIKK